MEGGDLGIFYFFFLYTEVVNEVKLGVLNPERKMNFEVFG